MANRGQLRSLAYNLISQVEGSGDFAATELNGWIDEGVRFLATITKWPRDKVVWQSVANTPAYTLPSDFILMLNAYFGDKNVPGDVRPMQILDETALASVRPSFLDETSTNSGRPQRICLLDRTTIIIDPPPNSNESTQGKQIIMGYVYSPAVLANDSDIPELPLTFHDLIPMYVQHNCYLGKLNKPDQAGAILKEIIDKAKLLEPEVTREIEVQNMTWGANADSLEDGAWGITVY